MDTLVERDFTISPTFAVKEATRDVMAAARREWHDTYTMPWQWRFYTISRKSHGSFFFDWTSEDETAGAEDYRLGMAFVRWWRKPRRKRALRKAHCPWKGFSALRFRLHAP